MPCSSGSKLLIFSRKQSLSLLIDLRESHGVLDVPSCVSAPDVALDAAAVPDSGMNKYKARDAEGATGLERAPPVCVQLKVWLEAPSRNRKIRQKAFFFPNHIDFMPFYFVFYSTFDFFPNHINFDFNRDRFI